MGYGTNGLNSNGTLMNVGNQLGNKSSIKLLGRARGYDTGHNMAALLGLRSLTDDEQKALKEERTQGQSVQQAVHEHPPAAKRAQRVNHWEAGDAPPQAHPHPRPHSQHGAPMQHRSPPPQHHSANQPPPGPGVQGSGLRVGMHVVTTKPIALHSGKTLNPGVVGVVCKVPGDLQGTVAEIDIPNGPLFDAWPGTVTPLPQQAPTSQPTRVARPIHETAPPQVGEVKSQARRCADCRRIAENMAKFCPQCGGHVR